MPQRLNIRAATETLMGLGLVVSAWYKLIYRLDELMEVRLYDESYYLWAGKNFFKEAIHPEFSPLYAFWYWILSQFEADGLKLYYLNYKVLSLLMPLAAYAMLRAAGVRALVAALLAIFLLASGMNLPVWPKMANLITSIVLLSATVLMVLNVKKQAVWLFTGVVLCVLFMYMRPEFVLGLMVFVGWFLWHIYTKRRLWDGAWLPAALLPLVFMIYKFGIPVGSGPRSMIAFGQHYMHNIWLKEGGSDEEMNIMWVNWREYIQPYFGAASSVTEALANNPTAFLRHVGYNVYAMVFKGVYVIVETVFPTRIFYFSPSILFLLCLLLVGYSLHGKKTLFGLISGVEGFGQKMLWMLIFSVPALAAALIFQPRAHYIMVMIVPFIFFVGLLFEHYLRLLYPNDHKANKYWALTLVAVYLSPGTEKFYAFRPAFRAEQRSDSAGVVLIDQKVNTQTIAKLNDLELPENIRLIDASTGYSYYLKKPFLHFGTIAFEFDYAAFDNVDTLIHKNNVNLIIVGETLRYDHSFAKNEGWNQLINHPELKGFTKHELGEAAYVLIKK
jgi:hypothetical protein